MKCRKESIISFIILTCMIFLCGCNKNNYYYLLPGDYITVKLFVYDDCDQIRLISAKTDEQYLFAHSSLVNNRSGNWCMNIESSTYIFIYLSYNEGQLSWGDTIKTDIGDVVSMERNLNVGNHVISVDKATVSICPYSLKDGDTIAENKVGNESFVYICAYNTDPRKDRAAILLDCYLLKLVQIKEYTDEYSYTHSYTAELTRSTFDFSRLIGG